MQIKNTLKACILILCFIALLGMPGTIVNIRASGDEVVAIVNGRQIQQSQLEPLITEYKKRTKKDHASQEDKIQLLKNLVRRDLVLQLDSTQELRKSREISTRVKEYEDQLVLEAYIKKNILDFLTVSEEEVKQYYSDNLHKFIPQPKVRASQILLRTEADAKQVLKRLQEGENFVELAKQYSIDLPRALEGGSLGIITKGQNMTELGYTVFTLNEGEISPIVKTRFGWHILRADEIIKQKYTPFEEVKDKIKVIVQQEKEAKAYDAMTRKLEKDADIKIFEKRL